MAMAMARAVKVLGVAMIAMPLLCGLAQAQTKVPVDAQPSRKVLEEAAGDACTGVSVVVSRCAPSPTDADAKKANDAKDPLSRSRAKTKAAFARRDRQAAQDTLDGKKSDPDASSSAARLDPITVTGTSSDLPPTVEEVIQRALNPTQTVTPGGTSVTYGPDGARTECIARCTGPLCCKTMKARPDPARESNSIGR